MRNGILLLGIGIVACSCKPSEETKQRGEVGQTSLTDCTDGAYRYRLPPGLRWGRTQDGDAIVYFDDKVRTFVEVDRKKSEIEGAFDPKKIEAKLHRLNERVAAHGGPGVPAHSYWKSLGPNRLLTNGPYLVGRATTRSGFLVVDGSYALVRVVCDAGQASRLASLYSVLGSARRLHKGQ